MFYIFRISYFRPPENVCLSVNFNDSYDQKIAQNFQTFISRWQLSDKVVETDDSPTFAVKLSYLPDGDFRHEQLRSTFADFGTGMMEFNISCKLVCRDIKYIFYGVNYNEKTIYIICFYWVSSYSRLYASTN